MPVISTNVTATSLGGGGTYFGVPNYRTNNNQQYGFRLLRVASDNTHIGVAVTRDGSGNMGFNVIVTADAATVSSGDVKASSYVNLAGLNPSNASFIDHTFSNGLSGQEVRFTPFAIDPEDNLHIPFLTNNGTYGGFALIRVSRPANGWAAWEASTETSITTTTVINEAYSVFPNNESTSTSNGAQSRQIFDVFYCDSVGGTTNDYLVTMFTHVNVTSSSFAGNLTLESRNPTTGAFVSRRAGSWNGHNGASFTVFLDSQQSSAFGAGGAVTTYSASSSTTNNVTRIAFWQVNSSGVLYSSNWNWVSVFGGGNDPTWSSGVQYNSHARFVFVSPNVIFAVGRNDGDMSYRIGLARISWNGGVNFTTPPGNSNSSPSSFGLVGTYTTTTGTGGTYGNWGNSSYSIQLCAFPENNFVRITNVSSQGYYDVPYTIAGGVTTPVPATSFAWNDGFYGAAGADALVLTTSTDSKMKFYYIDGGNTLSVRFADHQEDNPISFTMPSAAPSAVEMIQSPTTDSINKNGGIRFRIVKPSTYAPTTGHGSTFYGRFMPSLIGYKLRRVAGAVTDYLTASTGAFGASEVNNNSNTSFASAIVDSGSNQWANGTSYALSIAPNFTTGNTATYGATRTFTTTTPTAAPAVPTIRRILRRSFPALTDSHEYTFDNNAVINKINISNWGSSAATVAVRVGGFYLISPVQVSAGATLTVDTSQRVDANDRIQITSTSSSVDLWITGTEGI